MGAGTSSVRAATAAAVLALVVTLGACTGDPEPTPTSASPAPTSTTSTAPTSTAPDLPVPELPPDAQAQTDVGAVAFVKHWYAVVNYGFRTGETSPLDSISAPDCGTCEEYATVTTENTSNGTVLDGDSFVLEAVNAPRPEDGLVVVGVVLSRAAVNEVKPDGTTEPVPGAETLRTTALVRWINDEWVMQAVGPS